MQILLLCSDRKLIFEHIQGCTAMLLLLLIGQSVKNYGLLVSNAHSTTRIQQATVISCFLEIHVAPPNKQYRMQNLCSCSRTESKLFLEVVGWNFSELSETALQENFFTRRWIAVMLLVTGKCKTWTLDWTMDWILDWYAVRWRPFPTINCLTSNNTQFDDNNFQL